MFKRLQRLARLPHHIMDNIEQMQVGTLAFDIAWVAKAETVS
jgi:hypothetical protein